MATRPAPNIPMQEECDDPTIVYPCEDDEPLAETEFQYEPLTYAVAALKAHFGAEKMSMLKGTCSCTTA